MSAALMSSPSPPNEPVSRTCFDKHGQPFVVRPLAEENRPALLDFYETFEPKRGAQGLPPKGTERVKRWLESVLSQGVHLLAFRDGMLIGHALLMPTHTDGMVEYAVFLREDERGHGVGTELNRAAVEVAREAGMHRLWLSVELQNRAAVRSYEKAGFRFLPATIYSPEAEMELAL